MKQINVSKLLKNVSKDTILCIGVKILTKSVNLCNVCNNSKIAKFLVRIKHEAK